MVFLCVCVPGFLCLVLVFELILFFFSSANRVGRTGWLCMHAGEGVSMVMGGWTDGLVKATAGEDGMGRRPCKVD